MTDSKKAIKNFDTTKLYFQVIWLDDTFLDLEYKLGKNEFEHFPCELCDNNIECESPDGFFFQEKVNFKELHCNTKLAVLSVQKGARFEDEGWTLRANKIFVHKIISFNDLKIDESFYKKALK